MNKRLQSELKEIRRDPDPDIRLELAGDGDSVEEWTGTIRGPKDSPFEGGVFNLLLKCPNNYPMWAPKVWFITKIFHPNVEYKSGELCLDILKTEWSPVWSLKEIMRWCIALLMDPNWDSPLNCDWGNLIRNGDMKGFRQMARYYTLEYWMGGSEAGGIGAGNSGGKSSSSSSSSCSFDSGQKKLEPVDKLKALREMEDELVKSTGV